MHWASGSSLAELDTLDVGAEVVVELAIAAVAMAVVASHLSSSLLPFSQDPLPPLPSASARSSLKRDDYTDDDRLLALDTILSLLLLPQC